MDIVEQAIGIIRSGNKITDAAVVEVTDEELIKYMENVGAADVVAAARKDLAIAKQAALIHNLSQPADTEDKAPEGEGSIEE